MVIIMKKEERKLIKKFLNMRYPSGTHELDLDLCFDYYNSMCIQLLWRSRKLTTKLIDFNLEKEEKIKRFISQNHNNQDGKDMEEYCLMIQDIMKILHKYYNNDGTRKPKKKTKNKNWVNRIATISFYGIKIKTDKRLEIVNLFDVKYFIIIIDSIEINNKILTLLQKQVKFYREYDFNQKSKYINCAVIIEKKQKDILENILSLDEDLYLIGINNIEEIEKYQKIDELWKHKNGMCNIMFSNYESIIEITIDKLILDLNKKELKKSIKEIIGKSRNKNSIYLGILLSCFLLLLILFYL